MLDLIDFNPLECFHSEFHNGENVDRYPREPNNFLRKFIWTRLHLGHEISYILGLIRRRIINYRKIAPRWFPILITPGKSMDSKGISRLYMSFQEFCRSIQAWWNEEPMQWLFSSVSFREFGPLKSWSKLSSCFHMSNSCFHIDWGNRMCLKAYIFFLKLISILFKLNVALFFHKHLTNWRFYWDIIWS